MASFYEDLIEVAALKKDALRKKIHLLAEEEKDVKEKIMGFQEEELGAGRKDVSPPQKVVGVDGGSYPIQFLASDLYMIKTYGVKMHYSWKDGVYRHDDSADYRVLDVDFIIPQIDTQDRLTVYRQVTELRVMLRGLEEGYLVLGDGSLESLISRPTHKKLYVLDGSDDSIPTCEEIEKIVKERESEYSAMATKYIIEEEFRNDAERAVKTELAEKAYYLSRVFEEVAENQRVIVFITKTGRSTSLFKKSLPDQYILSIYTSKPGYIIDSIDTVRKILESTGSLPSYCGIKEKSKNVYMVNSYVRFVNGGPIMKTQLLLSAQELVSNNILEYYKLLIKRIGQTTDQGYPIPLYLAHQRAHIRKEAANIVLKALGLSEEFRGRESIEIL